jgi:hypothetical protein
MVKCSTAVSATVHKIYDNECLNDGFTCPHLNFRRPWPEMSDFTAPPLFT